MEAIDPRAKTARKKFGNGIPPVYRIALDWCRNSCPITGWQPKTVLDYGCGYARFADDFIRAGAFYVGTDLHRQDFSDQPLFEAELAKNLGDERADYLPSNYLSCCEGYDLVLLSNVVNVQETTEQLMALIRDAFRLIDKGGSVLLNYPRSPRRLPFNMACIAMLCYEWLDRRAAVIGPSQDEPLVLRLLK